jgi:hypothetical protein
MRTPRQPMFAAGLLGLATAVMAGCGLDLRTKQQKESQRYHQEREETIRKEIAELEALQPIGSQESIERMAGKADHLISEIHGSFEYEETLALEARVHKAVQANRVASSRLALSAGDASLAFEALRPCLVLDRSPCGPLDDAVLAQARAAAKARAEQRRAAFAKSKSYSNAGGGNCVFATKPFNGETPNDGLTYYATGSKVEVHARCYSESDLASFSGPDGHFVVLLTFDGYVAKTKPAGTPADYKGKSNVVEASFTIGLDSDQRFSVPEIRLNFSKQDGWAWQGDQKVATYADTLLAGSVLFVERAP